LFPASYWIEDRSRAAQVASLFPLGSFNVVLRRNILEYVDDPVAVLCGAARAMRDSSAILSVIVRNQAGEVLKAAIQAGDLAAAEQTLPLSGDMSLCTQARWSVFGRKPASHVDGRIARGDCQAWSSGRVGLFAATSFAQC
jgi:hypothetical protein